MNSTIGNSQFGTWKRIKTQSIAVAGGIALAVTVLAGAATLEFDSGSNSSAPAGSLSRSAQPFYPQVQEMSHPVVPGTGALEAATATGPFYPQVQEMSHPVTSTTAIEAAMAMGPFYLEVQELSHPVAPGTGALEAATATGPFYPQVQELSHPTVPETKGAPGTYPLVQEMSHPR